MSKLRLTFEVAKWEFSRFYKIKNELKGALYMLIAGIVGFLVMFFIEHGGGDKPELVLIGHEIITIDSTLYDRFDIHYGTVDKIDSTKKLVDENEIDGVIIFHSVDKGELYIREDNLWNMELTQLLTDYRRQTLISQSDLSSEEIDQMLGTFTLERVYFDEEVAIGRQIERGLAWGFIIAMLAAVFIGFAYQFTSITGEKQLRITEQIVSAISPQTWIDGKILGITGIGFATITFYSILLTLLGLGFSYYFGPGILAPLTYVNVFKILAFLIMAVMGILLWNSFLAAIAATINDPNSSERSAFMFLPLIPVAFAFAALVNPDSLIVRLLGIFPLTSSSMLPARMVLTDVHIWEFIVAVILLVGTIWIFRKVAAKIFSYGMLTYGKEPNIREMWKWMRESG